jgi:peptidylprolyl isomerase
MQVQKKTLIILAISLLVFIGIGWFMGRAPLGTTLVTFETNQGIIEITLASDMPITTGNFEKLVKQGFYDGTRFHRVIEGFMVQGGDPLSKDLSKARLWGTGDPGYAIKDEYGALNNVRGTIAMANAGPGTGGSQFFINVVDNSFLNGKHPVFGTVTKGMEVVDAIVSTETNAQDRPVKDILIVKASLK